MIKNNYNQTTKYTGALLLFLFSLALRIIKLILDPVLLRDSTRYLFIAKAWAEQGDYIKSSNGTIVPPFFLYIIKSVIKIGFPAEISGRSISLFVGSLIPILGYVISLRLFKRRGSAFITYLILALHPNLISFSTQPLRENLYLFLIGIAILATIDGITHSTIMAMITCGLYIAIAIFCRYEAIEMIIIVSVLFLFFFIKQKKRPITIICRFGILYASLTISLLFLFYIVDCDISFITKAPNYLRGLTVNLEEDDGSIFFNYSQRDK